MPVILNLCNYLRNTSKRTIIVCVLNVFLHVETDRVFKTNERTARIKYSKYITCIFCLPDPNTHIENHLEGYAENSDN